MHIYSLHVFVPKETQIWTSKDYYLPAMYFFPFLGEFHHRNRNIPSWWIVFDFVWPVWIDLETY